MRATVSGFEHQRLLKVERSAGEVFGFLDPEDAGSGEVSVMGESHAWSMWAAAVVLAASCLLYAVG